MSDDVGRLRRGYALPVEQACRGAARFGEQAHQDIGACHGHTPIQLASRKFGHDFRKLTERAEELGLQLKVRDKLALRVLKDTDAMANARYLETGFVRQLPHDRLDQICRGLPASVRSLLTLVRDRACLGRRAA
jgi:hypothetical protein